ncbi:MAG: UbiA family prenyltransferase [Microthrixaceae bacterium]
MRESLLPVRSEQWWDYKIPPLIGAATIAWLVHPSGELRTSGRFAIALGLFLLSAVGTAAFGHVLNDLCDVEVDAAADKHNGLTRFAPATRMLFAITALAVGVAPWVWLPRSGVALGLLGAEVALLTAYSAEPVRLKRRGVLGVLADALYAYVLPILLAMVTFSGAPRSSPATIACYSLVARWMFLVGLRGIAVHQLDDLRADRRAGVRTLALALGADRVIRTAGTLVVLEAVTVVATFAILSWITSSVLSIVLLTLYVLYRSIQLKLMWSPRVRLASLRWAEQRVRILGFTLINELLERWLAPTALVIAAVRTPTLVPVVVLYLFAFENAFVLVARQDVHVWPAALDRVRFARQVAADAGAIERVRLHRCSLGPAEVTPAVAATRRWVFVVCGPPMHIETLHTAIRHLRPLTRLEIWVVTDSRRGSRGIDTSLPDRVVDIETPSHLDDHQASIWLKTGLHRHVPPGEWCYLDSDIIAVAPGAEEVFDTREGPVAFASDLMIPDNNVDRFSPWAMTCDCDGLTTESCGHLRGQLRDRLGLDVDPRWLHWNGGVFVFDSTSPHSKAFLEQWHEIAVESFSWPEWRTRDQGALIATVWLLGYQELARIPQRFNLIVDVGNPGLRVEADRGWAITPDGPWVDPVLMHLYTCHLEDPAFDLSMDLERNVVELSRIPAEAFRLHQERVTRRESREQRRTQRRDARRNARRQARRELQARRRVLKEQRYWRRRARQDARKAKRHDLWMSIILPARANYWKVRSRLELAVLRTRHRIRRMRPDRIVASVRRRRARSAPSDASAPDKAGERADH